MQLLKIISLGLAFALVGCGSEKAKAPDKDETAIKTAEQSAAKAEKIEKTSPAPAQSSKALLITQSEFKADDKGQYTVPDAAVMLILSPGKAGWTAERIEDRDSNVFHKALAFDNKGIFTIGAEKAFLKFWEKEGDTWKAKPLWNPTFGGKFNRLREFEAADLDKDGDKDLAIATHDQGVVAVVWNRDGKWEAEELDRNPDTFVHEIEIGDLDQDGAPEIYATPSQPNTVSGKDQGGKIVRFIRKGDKFVKDEVVSFSSRHVKEILVTDLDSDGRAELYAALEAETDGASIIKPVEIRRFDLQGGKFEEKSVVTISDRFCRFLVPGDIDHDGTKELVASAFSSGVWVIEQKDGGYQKTCIDAKSGGFEHAAYITDIDGDNKVELYVADDRSGAIHRYDFADGRYKSKILFQRAQPSQAMVWNITEIDFSSTSPK